MNWYTKPVFHCEIPRFIHHQLCARRHAFGLQIAPEKRKGPSPTSGDTGVMFKMSLPNIAKMPFPTPPIAENLAVPVLILGNWDASDQKVTEAIACEMALKRFQDTGGLLELRNLQSGPPEFKEFPFFFGPYCRPPYSLTSLREQ